MLIRLFFAIAFFAVGGFSSLFGLDVHTTRIHDDSRLRSSLRDAWLTESPVQVMAWPSIIQSLPGGERVQVRVERGSDEFVVIFARELHRGRVATAQNAAVPRAPTGQFPGWAQGSWMLTRRIDTGAPVSVRTFLRSDPFTFVQFRPLNQERVLMDVVVYGSYLVYALPLSLSFERLYTMPVNDVLRLAGNRFPRRYFDPNPGDFSAQRQLVTQIRSRLAPLRFVDDGALNESGEFVFIATGQQQNPGLNDGGLNCSGFAKWLIDGILRPVTGERLAIPPLKAPFGDRGSGFTERWEDQRDPFFGLDWIRNLASTAGTVLRSQAHSNLEEIEVRRNLFSRVLVPAGTGFVPRSFPGFLPEAGFGIEGLHGLLYTLAIDEPGRFFLAAVNVEMGPATTPDNLRGAPRLRQYFHVAAFIPFFDEYGDFRIAVFESAAETSFAAFRNRYPAGHHVNLVRVPIVTAFDP
ncbi:MAG: hypothetical protein FWG66_11520 [Spirochaetes bacterium]|nr:hypothetical protein [Spirochaetota bacterium]